MSRYIWIRQYRPGDEDDCRRIVHAGTMSTVRTAFKAALTREVAMHLIVLTTAVMFVFMSLSPMTCLLSLPTTALLIYSAIFFAHVFKARTYDTDMLNIPRNYMTFGCTGFWVAETFEPMTDPNQCETVIAHGPDWCPPNGNFTRKIVGTAALVRCTTDSCASRMRRVAVDPDYQRINIASALIDEIIQFARLQGYETIELVTTECHSSARALYMKKGFELRQLYHKQIFLNIVQVLMYEFTYKLDR